MSTPSTDDGHKALTPDQIIVNLVRECLGKAPLYLTGEARVEEPQTGYGYVALERYKRAADPCCKRCSGSGYYDGERLSEICLCTGISSRLRRGESQDLKCVGRRQKTQEKRRASAA